MITPWEKAQQVARDLQNSGRTIVTTNGCFDLIHRGHVSYLAQARALGDFLIVAINSDDSVRRLKGDSRPINDEQARAYVLGALKCVDMVCLFAEDTPVQWLQAIKPNIHVKGGDWDPKKMVETPVLNAWGGEVKVLPYVEGYSTTGIIHRSQGRT